MESKDMVCFSCRNMNCDNYTIYRGYLMCEYCLDDWLKNKKIKDFEYWCTIHKQKLDEEFAKSQQNAEVKENEF